VVISSKFIYVYFFLWQFDQIPGHGLPLRGYTHWAHTLSRTPLDEWSARRGDLYLTTQHSQTTYMPPSRFEPTIPASERPQGHALDPEATRIGLYTGCHRRKGPNFGRVFLMLNYTDITQNTYPKLSGYGDNGQRKVWTSCISAYCTSTAV